MKVVIGKSKNRGTFHKNSITQTSSGIGFIQPTKMLPYTPHADITFDAGSKVRLNTLLTSTFGQMNMHQYFGTVDVDDVWKPWNHFRNGLPYAFTDKTEVPFVVPTYNLARLFITLIGAYDVDGMVAKTSNLYVLKSNGTFVDSGSPITPMTSSLTLAEDISTWIGSESARTSHPLAWWLAQGAYVRQSDKTFEPMDFIDSSPKYTATGYGSFDFAIRFLGSGGFPIVSTDLGDAYNCGNCLLIRLGQYGKKLRKLFKGLGYNIDGILNPLCYEAQQSLTFAQGSILPFLAYCKFIYDSQAIKRYADYDQTYLCKMIERLSSLSKYNTNGQWGSNIDIDSLALYETNGIFEDGVFDVSTNLTSKDYDLKYLGMLIHVISECLINSFYTIEPDMYSSTNDTVGLAFGESFNISSVIQDSDNIGEVSVGNSEVYNTDSQYYSLIRISQKLQHMVNRMNVLGASLYKRSKELLGVDPDNEYTLKSHFVGRYITPIQISDEIGTSADNLGQLGGKGLGQNRLPGKLHFKSNQYGYFFAVMCIVPRVGTFQGINPEYDRTQRYDFPTPDFDSLGYVPQASSWLYAGATSANGVQPRYFDFKFDHDIVNGDMDLLSNYTNMSPYWYQRIFNGRVVRGIQDGTFAHSDIYRRIGQHEDTGQFNRIFVNQDPRFDNFFVSIGFEITTKEDLLPVSESWDTVDDDERTDATSKA